MPASNKPSWTPGPWNVAVTNAHEIIAGYCIVAVPKRAAPDAREFRPSTEEEVIANARLIAAAPEMAEALNSLIAWDDAREEGEPTDCEMLDDLTQRIESARSALAKARGDA